MTTSTSRPPSRYSLGTVPNMLRSVVVVAAMVAALVLMVPRVTSVNQPPVDVTTSARAVVDSTGWPIVEPVDLPQGWKATSVRYVRSTGGLMTWHVGYVTPAGTYAAVEQTKDATTDWVRTQTNRAPKTGSIQIDGVSWDMHVRDQKVQNSLVSRGGAGGLTTIVTGTASFVDLQILTEHLTVVPAAS
ncbi:MAG: DUF4245 domain-containing protein [Nostocoides sp.]